MGNAVGYVVLCQLRKFYNGRAKYSAPNSNLFVVFFFNYRKIKNLQPINSNLVVLVLCQIFF
jgi:hypothetical protein